MYRESSAPHTILPQEIREIGLRQERRPQGGAGSVARLFSSGFVSRQIAPRKHLRVLPTRTRPSLFGGD